MISAKIFYATYAILIICSPCFRYHLQHTVAQHIEQQQQQQSTISMENSVFVWTKLSLCHSNVDYVFVYLRAVVVHIFDENMCNRSFAFSPFISNSELRKFCWDVLFQSWWFSFFAVFTSISYNIRHQQHCANYLNTLCMHEVKCFYVLWMVSLNNGSRWEHNCTAKQCRVST